MLVDPLQPFCKWLQGKFEAVLSKCVPSNNWYHCRIVCYTIVCKLLNFWFSLNCRLIQSKNCNIGHCVCLFVCLFVPFPCKISFCMSMSREIKVALVLIVKVKIPGGWVCNGSARQGQGGIGHTRHFLKWTLSSCKRINLFPMTCFVP